MLVRRSSFSRRIALSSALSVSLAALHLGAGALAGCGQTSGRRITLATRVVTEQGIEAPFKNAYGWSVTLTKAQISVGPLYYFSGPPVVASWPSEHRRSLDDWLAIPKAHAHPGHYTEGDATGQMLEPDTLDLLGSPGLADAEAITGRVESARFSFQSPPEGDLGPQMGEYVVWIEGEATRDDSVARFRATAKEPDILNADGNPFVEGCVFDAVDIEAPGTVTLTFHPAVWLDQVDFGEVLAEEDADRADLQRDTGPHRAFVRGLMKGTAYHFSYSR